MINIIESQKQVNIMLDLFKNKRTEKNYNKHDIYLISNLIKLGFMIKDNNMYKLTELADMVFGLKRSYNV